MLKKTLVKLCQETHEIWLKLLPIALNQIRAEPQGMLKLSTFEVMYDRPLLGSSQILGCPDPFIKQALKHNIQLGKVTENLK